MKIQPPPVVEPVKKISVHEIDRAHAKLSASGSDRWLNCTASAWMEAHFDDEGSEFADEGTRAHEMASDCLQQGLSVVEWRDRRCEAMLDQLWLAAEAEVGRLLDTDKIGSEEMKRRQLALRALRDIDQAPGYNEWMGQFEEDYPDEMYEVIDGYIEYVNRRIMEARLRNRDAIVHIERRVDFSKWVPEGFGTADCIIISDGVICVIDLKYGKGVFVDVRENSQPMLYALGAWSMYKHLFKVKTAQMEIYQPRIGNIAVWDMPVTQLLEWAEGTVQPTAAIVWHSLHNDDLESVEFDPTDVERCRFCKARNRCRARADYLLELEDVMAQYSNEEAIMPLATVARILPKTKHLVTWAQGLQDYARKEAEKGVQIPDHKLVEGRSRRRILDEFAVVRTLRMEGIKKERLYKSKLVGITDLKALCHGEKKMYTLIGEYIDKPRGKPTLVSNDDPRPVIDKVDAESQGFDSTENMED